METSILIVIAVFVGYLYGRRTGSCKVDWKFALISALVAAVAAILISVVVRILR